MIRPNPTFAARPTLAKTQGLSCLSPPDELEVPSPSTKPRVGVQERLSFTRLILALRSARAFKAVSMSTLTKRVG